MSSTARECAGMKEVIAMIVESATYFMSWSRHSLAVEWFPALQ